MASYHAGIVSFNAGEFSPFLTSRSDLEKYKSGCQRLENFLLLPYGGALRRPGTEYLGVPKFNNKRCRLHGFNFSTTTNFVIEFGDEYCRFWSNGEQVTVGGNPHEVATPYLEADLRSLQFCQVNDLLYIAHPEYPPAKLIRNADNDWDYQEVAWDWPPVLDENVENISIDPSGTGPGTITLTASDPIFEAGHIGSYWLIGHRRNNAWKKISLGTTTVYSSELFMLPGEWEVTTYGSWQGTVFLERRSTIGGEWEIIRAWNSSEVGHRNVSATGREEKPCALRISFEAEGEAGDFEPVAILELAETRGYGIVQITGFTSATSVTAETDENLYLFSDAATNIWHEAAFSDVQGYPRAVALHDQRLLWAGTAKKPLSIHGSQIDDFEDFLVGELADEAIFFTIASNESNPINWMISQQGTLLIGNAGEEWTFERSDESEALGSANVKVTRQSSYGSAYIQPRMVNEVVMFVQRQARKVRELTFAFEKDGWVSPDLTVLAPHITGDGIVETAFQQQPDACYWIITADGNAAGMTYERDQNVVGWHKQTTDGTFESVATIYGGTAADEVWFSVQREINGETVRYIERMQPDHREFFEDMDKFNYWYADAGARFTSGSPTTTVTGADHLEGKTVMILADGATQEPKTVTGGSFDLESPASNVFYGLPYTSVLKPMNIEIPMQDGSTKSRTARVHRVALEVYKSMGCQVSSDDENWDDVYFRLPQYEMDSSPPPFTGKKKVPVDSTYEDYATVAIRITQPLPLCLLSLTPILDFHGVE